jgi:hypothetical protein
MVSWGGEEPKMSSRELSTAGLSGWVWVDIVVAGEDGVDSADEESVIELMALVYSGKLGELVLRKKKMSGSAG